MEWSSVAGVVEVDVVRGARAEGPPSLLLEVPHGATAAAHFHDLRARLRGVLPPGLDDFFFVNTDVGAPELARALAAAVVDADPRRSVLVLRCLVPRTFIDVNRVLDLSAADYKAGRVTPGVPPWIVEPEDHALLRGLYAAWHDVAQRAFEAVCEGGGCALMVHSYAPRSVDVEVDAGIGAKMRRAYAPDVEPTWPLRPEVDLIVRDPDGNLRAPEALVDGIERALAGVGLTAARSATYPLHPSTTAYRHVTRWPDRTLCLEVRRDLLAEPFSPFEEMVVPRARAERIAAPIAAALRAWWGS